MGRAAQTPDVVDKLAAVTVAVADAVADADAVVDALIVFVDVAIVITASASLLLRLPSEFVQPFLVQPAAGRKTIKT